MVTPTPRSNVSRGELMELRQIAQKAEISESTIKRIIQGGHVEPIKIGRNRFIHYRDFLRAYWDYECSKERLGRKPANAKWED